MKIFAFISPQRFHCKINFLGGLILGGQFWKCTKCEGGGGGVEILRHKAGLLCKRCQTILWLKQIHVSKVDKKICFGGSLSTTKCYPYKVWPRNLSAISTTRNVACVYAHMPMHTAETWKKYIDFFYFLKAFLSLNWDQYFAFFGVFVLGFPLSFYWLSGVKSIRMWSHRPWLRLLTKPTTILSQSIM